MEQQTIVNANIQRDIQNSKRNLGEISKKPLKDATNKANNKPAGPSENILINKKENHYSNEYNIDLKHPENYACFCCGGERKLDGEILFGKLIDPDFLKLLDEHLRIPEREQSLPPSPVKLTLPKRSSIDQNNDEDGLDDHFDGQMLQELCIPNVDLKPPNDIFL